MAKLALGSRESQIVASGAVSLDAGAAEALGHQIARRRAEIGLSQQGLADRIGMSKGQLQVIERGWSDRAKRTPANPRLSTLLALCRELGGRIDVTFPVGVEIVFDERPGDA